MSRLYNPYPGIAGMPVPPSYFVPIRRQANEPTTGTPNLRWSVARLDALKLALLNRHNLLPDIAKAFGAPVQEIIRLSHEMAVTVHRNEGRKV